MVGALLLYMAFLMLVDPLIRKPDAYTEQLHNEEENEVTGFLGAGALPVPLPTHMGVLGSKPVGPQGRTTVASWRPRRGSVALTAPMLQLALLLFSVLHVIQTPEFSSAGNG